jgi:type II secretion system protein N
MVWKLEGWKRYAAYGALFAAAFALALRQTFPADAVRERLVMEAASQGWQVRIADVGPGGMLGVRFTGVTLESREGARVPLEEVQASLRLWPLLLGRRGLDYRAQLFQGQVRGLVEEGRSARRLVAHLSGIDLAKAGALRKALGVDLGGTLGGDVDLTFDAREPARSTGRVDLRVDKAALLGGQVSLPSFGGALTLPRADLGAVVAQASVREGKAIFDKLEARSPDVELFGEGLAVTLQTRLAFSPIFGKARFRFQDAFWQKGGSAALKGVTEAALAQARGKDGSYWFQVFGTVSAPQARPAPQ